MIRAVLFASLLALSTAQAATTGGNGGKLGFSSDSGHGSPGAGGTGGGFSSQGRMQYDSRNAPPLAEKRKVNEQDCTKPIDPTAGNLRCK